VTGSAGDQGNAGFAGQAAMGVGHVHGGGFVPHVNEVDARIQRGIEDRHDVVAGQREDTSAAETAKRTSDDVGAA
jgi:hypothetical protein